MTNDKDLAGDSEWSPSLHPGHEFGPSAKNQETCGSVKYHKYMEICTNIMSNDGLEDALTEIVNLGYMLTGAKVPQDISTEMAALKFKQQFAKSFKNFVFEHTLRGWITHREQIGEASIDFELLRTVVSDRLAVRFKRLFSDNDQFVPDGL